jgi:hypothetical protein
MVAEKKGMKVGLAGGASVLVKRKQRQVGDGASADGVGASARGGAEVAVSDDDGRRRKEQCNKQTQDMHQVKSEQEAGSSAPAVVLAAAIADYGSESDDQV